MITAKLSTQKANIFSTGVFLIALGILAYLNWWWPGMLIALWALFATRQLLTGRINDFFITSLLLLGIFATYYIRVNWDLLAPLLLIIAGVYIILREYFYKDSRRDKQIEPRVERVEPREPKEETKGKDV